MPDVQPWSIAGSDGQPIIGNTHAPDADIASPRGVVLLCHGFKGYKDYGFFPFLARFLASQGLLSVRFNFSHSGMTENIDTFERPDLFERDTWSKQVHDLIAVAQHAAEGKLPGVTAAGLPMVWFGHSRGGVTVALAARRAFEETNANWQPQGVILASAPHQACSMDQDQRRMMRDQGYMESPSSRTRQRLRVGRTWLDEIEAAPQTFDPLQAIATVHCPVLIIHGADDPTVHVAAAQEYARAGGDNATAQIIDDASHTFNAPNPMNDEQAPPQTTQLAQEVSQFSCRVCG